MCFLKLSFIVSQKYNNKKGSFAIEDVPKPHHHASCTRVEYCSFSIQLFPSFQIVILIHLLAPSVRSQPLRFAVVAAQAGQGLRDGRGLFGAPVAQRGVLVLFADLHVLVVFERVDAHAHDKGAAERQGGNERVGGRVRQPGLFEVVMVHFLWLFHYNKRSNVSDWHFQKGKEGSSSKSPQQIPTLDPTKIGIEKIAKLKNSTREIKNGSIVP